MDYTDSIIHDANRFGAEKARAFRYYNLKYCFRAEDKGSIPDFEEWWLRTKYQVVIYN